VLTIVIVDMRSLGRVHRYRRYRGTRGSIERWNYPGTRSDRRRWRRHCSKFELFYSRSQKTSENDSGFELRAQARRLSWQADRSGRVKKGRDKRRYETNGSVY
jgi:hypothetical protein